MRVGVDAEHALDLRGVALRVRGRQVDLVERRHDLEVVLDRLVAVGQRLGLDPLARVDEQDRALAGRERPRDLVAEVDVARACRSAAASWPSKWTRTFWALIVMPRSRSRSIESRYWARMSRALTAPGELEDPVRERGLAVVDVADDREVPDRRGRDGSQIGATATSWLPTRVRAPSPRGRAARSGRADRRAPC